MITNRAILKISSAVIAVNQFFYRHEYKLRIRQNDLNVPGIARCIMGIFLSGAGSRVIQNSRSSFKAVPGHLAMFSPFPPSCMVSRIFDNRASQITSFTSPVGDVWARWEPRGMLLNSRQSREARSQVSTCNSTSDALPSTIGRCFIGIHVLSHGDFEPDRTVQLAYARNLALWMHLLNAAAAVAFR